MRAIVRFAWSYLLAAALLASGCSAPDGPDEIPLRILAINDFHGNIATSSDAFEGVGRADYLAANISAARAEVENSVFVSAGDLIGASPLISALFHDEPTIEVMNLMGLDFNGVGNHEFDEGLAELKRIQQGGSHPVDGDLDGDPFSGARFEILAANVIDDSTGETIFPPYRRPRLRRRGSRVHRAHPRRHPVHSVQGGGGGTDLLGRSGNGQRARPRPAGAGDRGYRGPAP